MASQQEGTASGRSLGGKRSRLQPGHPITLTPATAIAKQITTITANNTGLLIWYVWIFSNKIYYILRLHEMYFFNTFFTAF